MTTTENSDEEISADATRICFLTADVAHYVSEGTAAVMLPSTPAAVVRRLRAHVATLQALPTDGPHLHGKDAETARRVSAWILDDLNRIGAR